MYREFILDLYRNPHNFGRLKKPTHTKTLLNPVCGDKITVDMVIHKGRVKEVAFEGESCAISRAAASLLTDYIIDRTPEELVQLDAAFMSKLIEIDVSPGRIKCLLLPLEIITSQL